MNPSQEPAQPQPPHDPALFGGARPGGQDGFEPGAAGGFGLAHPFGPEPVIADDYARRWWGFRRSERRPWRRSLAVCGATALGVLALGVPLGLLWAWIAPEVPVINSGQNGVVVNDPSPEEYIAADGWFTLLGLGFGILVAIVAWLVLRRDRGPFLLLGVVAGAFGAGWLAGPLVGEAIGRSAYDQWRETAVQGATYLAPPEVHSVGPTLVPAFAAAIVLTLLAGWSNDPDLDQPGAKPGYGPNAEADEPHAINAWSSPFNPATPAPPTLGPATPHSAPPNSAAPDAAPPGSAAPGSAPPGSAAPAPFPPGSFDQRG
ncbi:hypothetical protein [Paractinoplanes rishiriensis]|uniref:DUF2567 domain-containing protein n=1 Tax=Paractinoplanes rishiriensis TaxID=1050105 RepID=A0A919K144_9ACTN|nr:hypothetical protein [Actinoplanes rishiriensis]GIE96904.1 hypothetical protein Ari01nite_43690 [Actinoplanes rishiriensis]